jgi:Mrp family chromosome partitioning ATPase
VKLSIDPEVASAVSADFDLLRAKLEFEVARPAVIAITASTAEDGKDTVARELANSFVNTGYTTLYLDTCLAGRTRAKPAQRLTLEEAGREIVPDPGDGELTVLSLDDMLLQRTTSQRHIQAALAMFRNKFDYIIVNTEYGDSTAFAASVIVTADAVLAIVKKGRREEPEDARLAASLERIGSRFLGVVAVDPSIFVEDPAVSAVAIPDWRRTQKALANKEHQRREIVEWPT